MPHTTTPLAAALLLSLAVLVSPVSARAQQTPSSPTPSAEAQQTPGAPTPNAGATTNAGSPAVPSASVAKDIEGLDVFSLDGQQVGKVAKVNLVADGKVKDVEILSGGFLGFFSKTYIVPAEKLNKKGGRVELAMTSEQAKQFAK